MKSAADLCRVKTPRRPADRLKKRFDYGDIYQGNFTPYWKDKSKGPHAVVVLRDDGALVFVAPISSHGYTASSQHFPIPRAPKLTIRGLVLADKVCSIEKHALERKKGRLPEAVLEKLNVALLVKSTKLD
jgi:mRNA-degrading endonuclease toxin of MazEF toxin-antitoxin module